MRTSSEKWIKEEITTSDAPSASGPYNQAIAVGQMIFVSGQLGLLPGTKEFAESGIEGQTAQALENIAAILDAAGSSLEDVVRTTIFLADMDHFKGMNDTYSRFFPIGAPARSTVAVTRLPLGALVEIDAIAIRD